VHVLVDGLDVGAVRRVVHVDPLGPHAIGRAVGEQLGERGRLAGDDRRRRAVDRGDENPLVPGGQ
jgi:hypothetical protein